MMVEYEFELTDDDVFQLHSWQYGTGDWFRIRVLNLLAHADMQNRAKASLAWPRMVWLYEQFQSGAVTEDEVRLGRLHRAV